MTNKTYSSNYIKAIKSAAVKDVKDNLQQKKMEEYKNIQLPLATIKSSGN